jgi:hypothetical protein
MSRTYPYIFNHQSYKQVASIEHYFYSVVVCVLKKHYAPPAIKGNIRTTRDWTHEDVMEKCVGFQGSCTLLH